MAPASLAKIGAAFLLLFGVSLGAGYAVGAQVRGDDATTLTGASATRASTGPPTTAPTLSTSTVDGSPTIRVTPSTTAVPTTTVPAGPRRPTRANPLRVVMAGDSVMAGLTPPVKDALEADGTTTVRFILTPSILRDPAVRFTWTTQLEQFNPEVVVMFVGTWESGVVKGATGLAPTDPRWRAKYESDVLDPWIQLITSRGATVLWIGNPTVRNDDANVLFGALNAAFKDLPARWAQVSYLASDPVLNGAGPGYHDVLVKPDGTSVRTRQTDGLHLCAGGAELLGRLVIKHLTTTRKAVAAPAWETKDWREDAVYPIDRCPAN